MKKLIIFCKTLHLYERQLGGKMKQNTTKRLVLLALFLAIEYMLFSIKSIGLIKIFTIEITTLHIPVIIASCILGIKEGMIVGAFFGFLSFMEASTVPLPHAFLFSPLAKNGNFFSLIIAFVPRIILGFIPGFILSKLKKSFTTTIVASTFASIIHTVLAVSMMGIFFLEPMTILYGGNSDALIKGFITLISVNGVVEAILAGICGVVVYRLQKMGY